MVDLVFDCSAMEEDNRVCSSTAGIGAIECSVRPKRKSRGCRSEGARSKLRGKKARKMIFRVFCVPTVLAALLQTMLRATTWWRIRCSWRLCEPWGQCSDRKAS